ncbi:MAG TPA: hypothetical protein VGA99_10980 [bacterium]
MMSKRWLLTVLLLLPNFAAAQNRGFGIGIILGEPTGISLKNWLSPSSALDFAVAWSFERYNSFTIHADYLKHNFRLIRVEKGTLPFYYGIGGRIKLKDEDAPANDDEARLGARVPAGLAYHFENVTLDVFIEVVPILELVPSTDFTIGAAIGIRYFFK